MLFIDVSFRGFHVNAEVDSFALCYPPSVHHSFALWIKVQDVT